MSLGAVRTVKPASPRVIQVLILAGVRVIDAPPQRTLWWTAPHSTHIVSSSRQDVVPFWSRIDGDRRI